MYVPLYRKKGKVVLLGDFNARVGRSADVDDVIGMFGEDASNASGNRLVSFLNEVEMVVCNGRKFMLEPEWTRVRPSLSQRLHYNRPSVDGSVRECACRHRMLRPLFSMDGTR